MLFMWTIRAGNSGRHRRGDSSVTDGILYRAHRPRPGDRHDRDAVGSATPPVCRHRGRLGRRRGPAAGHRSRRAAAPEERRGEAGRGARERPLHNDYVTGGRALALRRRATYAVPAGPRLSFDAHRVDDGDTLRVGPLVVAALGTPGAHGRTRRLRDPRRRRTDGRPVHRRLAAAGWDRPDRPAGPGQGRGAGALAAPIGSTALAARLPGQHDRVSNPWLRLLLRRRSVRDGRPDDRRPAAR